MRHQRFLLFLALAFLTLVPSAFPAAKEGWFGFSVKVDAPFFSFNPILRSAVVQKVVANSPAAKGGIAAEDQIIEVEGVAIAGRRAKEIEPLMEKAVGETLHLRLKRSDGSVYSASLVAEQKAGHD